MSTPLSLSQLNAMASEAVACAMAGYYNVVTEISQLNFRNNGHCYLTFIEKSPTGNALARADAHIWRSRWLRIAPRFEQVTGKRLAMGMKVLATVEVELHPVFGYALNVIDIDPAYTLGEQAARREAVIRQLKADGIYEMQKELLLPRPLTKIAVVSSATAAGYGDFCRQIEQSGHPFILHLYEATMQGASAAQSIIQALTEAATSGEGYDAMVIIRGGGAVDDLVCFDDYDLASVVAQFPMPILSGIGHERDTSVVDLVAHQAFKTPTAVAAFLVATRDEELRLIDDLKSRLENTAVAYLQAERFRVYEVANRLGAAAANRLAADKLLLTRYALRLQAAGHNLVNTNKLRLTSLTKQLALLNPQNILDRGYSLTTCNGKVVHDAATLHSGDVLHTRFKQGEVKSSVV